MKKTLVLFLFLLLAGCNSDDLQVKISEKTIECGEKVSVRVSDYLDISDSVNKKDIITEIFELQNGTWSKQDYYDGSDEIYLAAGQYEIHYTYKDETKTVTITMEDTTPPVIEYNEQKTFITGSDPVDLVSLVTFNDWSDSTISISGEIDYNTPGDYTITFRAVDEFGNASTKEVTFNVVNK